MSNVEYAISEYPDVPGLLEKLYHLANKEPMHAIKRDKMEEYLSYFDKKCKGSKISRATLLIKN